MQVVKGMVQVHGATYRVVRLGLGAYQVIRLLDDVVVGEFRTVPPLTVAVQGIDKDLMMAIARAAIQRAKTSWIGRLSPT